MCANYMKLYENPQKEKENNLVNSLRFIQKMI